MDSEPNGILKIRNWERWQSYRKDRGSPPWIKVDKALLTNCEFLSLTDAQRGQLVVIWLLSSEHSGVIPTPHGWHGDVNAASRMLQRIGSMDSEPDLQLFIDLGFIATDANVTPKRRQRDANVTPQSRSEEIRVDQRREDAALSRAADDGHGIDQGHEIVTTVVCRNGTEPIYDHELAAWTTAYPTLDVPATVIRAATWCGAQTKARRWTRKGCRRGIVAWLNRDQERQRPPAAPPAKRKETKEERWDRMAAENEEQMRKLDEAYTYKPRPTDEA